VEGADRVRAVVEHLMSTRPQPDAVLKGDASRVSLRYCDLTRMDLREAQGLMAWELAGSDLRGAQLPPNFHFDLLVRAENAAKDSARVFGLILLASLLCWLVRIGTSDVEMALQSSQAALPFVDFKINVTYFYILAPLLLLLAYVYFHFGLQQIWEAIANLPIYFPDGIRLDKKLYPWPLLRVSELVFPALWAKASYSSRLRLALTAVLFWLAVPTSLTAFWLHYLSQRSPAISSLHLAYLALSLSADIFFFPSIRGDPQA
jgi:hypothetical protein